jgi:hypothetical protein
MIEPVSPGFILPFCRYRPVQADASLPGWSSLPTELKYMYLLSVAQFVKHVGWLVLEGSLSRFDFEVFEKQNQPKLGSHTT